jgi:hypothetical protein
MQDTRTESFTTEPLTARYLSARLRRARWRLLTFLLGATLALAVAAARAWPPPMTAMDIEQTRLDVALPPLPDGQSFVQTFRPAHDGLTEVELILAQLAANAGGDITLRLENDAGELVAAQTWPAGGLRHNQSLSLRFPPQPASAGRLYSLALSSSDDPALTFWGYSLDVYAGGELAAPGTPARELRFVTRYQLVPAAALRTAVGDLAENAGLLLLALALALMPGALLLSATRPRALAGDRAAWWGVALALGITVWPLLWYWLTLLGGRWQPGSLALLLGAGWALVAWRARHTLARLRPARASWARYLSYLALLLLLLGGLAVRLLAVRDQAFPLWVDPIRHALITQVMVERGQMIRDYAPFLPVTYFPYHAGFHTLPAGLALLGIGDLPRLLQVLGQLLNALAPLTIYAAAWLVTRRRLAALLAAFLVAFPFYFPGYYASWGRLTQLTGVLILPVLLALTWLVAEGRRSRQLWWLVGLLAAGLLFIHFRVFLIFLPFVPLAWLVAGKARAYVPLALATALALLLTGPRLWELSAATSGAFSGADAGYNEFPVAYVTAGWERAFLVAGGAALLLAIVPAISGRRWARFTLTLAAWSGLLLLAVSAVPSIWLINLNSVYITMFVPLVLTLGAAVAAAVAWWRPRPLAGGAGSALLGALLAAMLLGGARQQIQILNPATQLAHPADLAGLHWVNENLPADALIAVNAWHWLGGAWAGSDGGGWLLPVTGRQTTTPPADYVYSADLVRQVAAFNQAAQAVPDWSDPAAAAWLASEGVTHIFVGARGGFFDPAALGRNAGVELEFSENGVFVFRVRS